MRFSLAYPELITPQFVRYMSESEFPTSTVWQAASIFVPKGELLGQWDWLGKTSSTADSPSSGYLDRVLFEPVLECSLTEGLDLPALTWHTGPEEFPWFGQGAITKDGEDAVMTPMLKTQSRSYLQTQVPGPGNFSYSYRMDRVSGYKLVVYLAKVREGIPNWQKYKEISYSTGEWTAEVVTIPEGLHQVALQWESNSVYNEIGKSLLVVDQVAYALTGLWSGEQLLPEGLINSIWFGTFLPLEQGWIYHLQHDWVYCVGTSASQLWLYTPDLGWLWTSQAIYPFLYRWQDGTWLSYYAGSDNPRYFYNHSTFSWELH